MYQNRYASRNNKRLIRKPQSLKIKTPSLDKEKQMKSGLMKQDQMPHLRKNQSLKDISILDKTRKLEQILNSKVSKKNGRINQQSKIEIFHSQSLSKKGTPEYEFRSSKSLRKKYSIEQHSLTPSLVEKKLRLKQLRSLQSVFKDNNLQEDDQGKIHNQSKNFHKNNLKDHIDRCLNMEDEKHIKRVGNGHTLKDNLQSSSNLSNQKNIIHHQKLQKYNHYEITSQKKTGDYLEIERSDETMADQKIDQIRRNIKGFTSKYISPFGLQIQSVYVDHTATNRPYTAIENMIKYSKKFAANPLTQFSHFGKYSTQILHYAHDSLLQSFHTNGQLFVALPVGSGCTGAIEKTIRMLKTIETNSKKRPNIFLTSYQHHSNILPWAEFYDKVQVLESEKNGDLKLKQIQKQLLNCENEHIIVSVSAASNVTSKITSLLQLNQIIKRVKSTKKLLFCVDCAAYACHHALDLSVYDAIDFVFLSPHKNLGGAQSSGVLIARKSVIQFAKPTFPGGGTVRFVKGFSKQDVLYQIDAFSKQIAGTPNFLGFYRAALSFELLHYIGYDYIHQRQFRNTKHFVLLISQMNARLKQQGINAKFEIYGDKKFTKRANVITFNLKYDNNNAVNHSLASLLYTDIFGIQLRSGCFCAGPLGFNLLQFSQIMIAETETTVHMGITKKKPGFLRLDLTFYLQLFEIQYIVKASQAIVRYWHNVQRFYTITSYGKVNRHEFVKQDHKMRFDLSFADELKQQIIKNQKIQDDILENRQKTLQKQYNTGVQFMKNPISYLSKTFGKNKRPFQI